MVTLTHAHTHVTDTHTHTQIDTLLQDMSGTIDTTQPTSPVAKEHSPSNQSASSIISSWLRGLSLDGYGSVLETNGFDRLEYYVSSFHLLGMTPFHVCLSVCLFAGRWYPSNG